MVKETTTYLSLSVWPIGVTYMAVIGHRGGWYGIQPVTLGGCMVLGNGWLSGRDLEGLGFDVLLLLLS
jgi:hypothetical protein